MKIGSLCTGYGGLDMAVEAYFAAETVWCAEYDKYASQLIAERFDYPNYGDIKSINWAELEPIDILTAGYPCQPFSHAGDRKGLEDERHIFPYILEAISTLRPRYVILENVRGHLSLGLKEVLAGLTQIGYDAKWKIVRASDVGAPHQRARLFIIAYPISQGLQGCGWKEARIRSETTSNTDSNAHTQSRRADRGLSETSQRLQSGKDEGQAWDEHGCSSQIIGDPNDQHFSHNRQMSELGSRFASRREMSLREAPNTLDQLGRLNPPFVEYMMGLPKGWVTESGLSRSQQLKMLGNGVVPQQAYYAIQQLRELDTPL